MPPDLLLSVPTRSGIVLAQAGLLESGHAGSGHAEDTPYSHKSVDRSERRFVAIIAVGSPDMMGGRQLSGFPLGGNVERQDVNAEELRLPPCQLPRPGEAVQWYLDSAPCPGSLVGHTLDGKPFVSMFGRNITLDSFEMLRLADPLQRRNPNWSELPEDARIVRARDDERATFDLLLNQRTPPGPRYRELIEEIWSRGFEVFVVGGTVRDVIARCPSNDIDLVTTMPLARMVPLLTTMYRMRPREMMQQAAMRNGHLRPGSRERGGPYIDLSVFKHSLPGSEHAVFGSSFIEDVAYRDFSINAVYYDPINGVLIDASGCGIDDIEAGVLRLVSDGHRRNPHQTAKLVIRFFKFCARGYVACDLCITEVENQLLPHVVVMEDPQRVQYTRTQVLSKALPAERAAKLDAFGQAFVSFSPAASRTWGELFEPLREAMLR